MKKCQVFWKIIKKNHLSYVFGLPGTPLVPLLAHKPNTIQWVNIGNELDNGFIAQSYGLFSQKTGVLIVTVGPGIGSTISSIANAVHEKYPLVVISCIENEGFHDWDVLHVSRAVTKYTLTIRPQDDFEKKINYAFYVANTFNTGVIVLIVPSVFMELTTYRNVSPNFRKMFHFNSPSQIVSAIREKFNGTDLLVVLGYMHHVDYHVLKEFLTTNNLPYVLTWKERTRLTDHNFCGMIGTLGTHSAHYAVYHARNLLIFGNVSSRLNNSYNGAFSLNYKLKKENICSVVLEPSDAIKHSTETYTTDDFTAILSHLRLNASPAYVERVTLSNAILRDPLPPKSEIEKYSYVSSLLYQRKKLNIPVVTGVGSHWCAVGKYMSMSHPNTWLSSTEWASIGCGYFYGIGAYLATKKPVWIFEGDGGTVFSSTSLLYLINNRHLPLTVILFRDNLYAAVVATFETKMPNHKKNEDIVCTPPHLNYDILPNCHHFHSLQEYYDYMWKHPVSKTLRFVIVHLKKQKTYTSKIYAVNNHDKQYTALLRENNLEAIKTYESRPYDFL
jgi:acetolactate synthase-1/2/3 large subunit